MTIWISWKGIFEEVPAAVSWENNNCPVSNSLFSNRELSNRELLSRINTFYRYIYFPLKDTQSNYRKPISGSETNPMTLVCRQDSRCVDGQTGFANSFGVLWQTFWKGIFPFFQVMSLAMRIYRELWKRVVSVRLKVLINLKKRG